MFYKIRNSCNCLICFGVSYGDNCSLFDACICNPITKEYVALPKLEEGFTRNGRVMSGFGYLSLSDEYKVIRIYNEPEKPNVGLVDVYTLGSGRGWRNVGEFNREIVLFASRHGTFVNGAIYWINANGVIVVFDLVDENFLTKLEFLTFGYLRGKMVIVMRIPFGGKRQVLCVL
ncbi:putative F-box protein At4g21240 [Papaver somniferum]|uniref:putative F-box protein At4g21240 n=1 Tax=Papaver somniferum TaxID=3469 RepID=UPI000E701758|nr:putative F-box protein At4g21240 [Papaver somniferum]